MRGFLTKTFAHPKRGPITSGIISPTIAIILFVIDTSLNNTNAFRNLLELTAISGVGWIFIFFGPFVMGICSKRISLVFLDHSIQGKSIRDSFDLLHNMTKVFYLSLISFAFFAIIEIWFFGKIITSTDIVDFSTNLFYTIHMVNLFVILMSLLSIFPRLDYKFKFGYSRICLKFCLSDETDEMEKIEYFSYSMEAYNFFLGKYSNMELKNPDGLSSKLLCEPKENRLYIIERLEKSFDKGYLGPLEIIKKIIQIKNPSEFFIHRKRFSNAKPIITIIGSLAPVVYFGIQFIVNLLKDLF